MIQYPKDVESVLETEELSINWLLTSSCRLVGMKKVFYLNIDA